MFKRLIWVVALPLLALSVSPAWADEYSDTINTFKKAGEAGRMLQTAYGYAVFPSIGKGAVGIGGAHGKGRVYEKGKYIGDTSMTQITVGFQLGGEAYSELILFQDASALKNFTSGNFEFGADAHVIAVTAAAGAKASTTGSSAGASATKNDAATAGAGYTKGMATFTVSKGGLMYEASIGGQKFNYKPK